MTTPKTPLEFTWGTAEDRVAQVVSHLAQQRADNPQYRVIDIGADGGGGWSDSVIDYIVDINTQPSDRNLAMDICRDDQWQPLLDLVDRHGLFDYAICSHTLEDIYNPFTALDLLPRIARAGIIITPSANTELSHGDRADLLGYVQHRWIFDQQDGELFIMPKLGYLERDARVHKPFRRDIYELRCEWQGQIPYRVFMDNFLSGGTDRVVAELNACLDRCHS